MAEAFAVQVGTGLAIEAANALFKLVIRRASEETTLAWGSKDQLKNFNRQIEVVGAFLEDLSRSKKEQGSALVETWLKRVKDVFNMADNVMDEYAYANIRRKLKHKNPSVVFRFRMYLKVRKILSLFDDLDVEAKNIGLNQVKLARDATSVDNNQHIRGAQGWLQAREFVSPSKGLVGRENDVKILLDRLCSPAEDMGGDDISTVAIIGMGGLGKTTLARRLFDHEKIGAHFAGKKRWICVSKDFTILRILNEMLESVTPGKESFSNPEAIIAKLQKDLKLNKLLLVLDDVWDGNRALWDSLKESLERIGALRGSVILITTRSHEVAKNARDASPHFLKELSGEESWAVLNQYVLISGNSTNISRREEVGRRILEKCKGVPLAIKVIGSLLQSLQYLHEWESIERSELWTLPQGQTEILPSLILSFNLLPYLSLKQSFSYLSIFPRDTLLYRSELISLWSAQGYLCDDKTRNLSSMEIGEEYLRILRNSSLLQEGELEWGERKFVYYHMHDLVYDLAVFVSGNELIKEANELQEKGDCVHLTFTTEMSKSISEFPSEEVLRKLRTIYLISKDVPWNMLIQARYLRNLFLVNTGIEEVPTAIGLLKHLRCLDLSFNPIRSLPDSISKLYQLETLALQTCKYMTKLPKVLNSLANLRCIWTETPMFASKGLAQLSNLQTVPFLALEANGVGWTIDELGKLNHLHGEIGILALEYVRDKEEAKKAGLAGKAKVTKLTLSWTKGRGESESVFDEEVIGSLEPHPNITSLNIENFNGERFPSWIMTMAVLTEQQIGSRTILSNLTVVKLQNCSRCCTLPTLGQLPLLECLTLSGLSANCIGNEFYDDEDLHTPSAVSFQCLRELEICDFQSLTTWRAPSQEAFPCLEILRLRYCPSLESVPVLDLKSLRSLELENLNVKSLDLIKHYTSLTSFLMTSLPKITSLPPELGNCRELQKLHLTDICKLVSLPAGLESLVCLTSLEVHRCFSLKFLPEFHDLSSLRVFSVAHCPCLREIPSRLEGCTSLECLMIYGCRMVESPPTNFSKLRSLTDLWMSYGLAKHMKSMIESVQHLRRIQRLSIHGYRSDEEMRECFSDITLLNSIPSLTSLSLIGHPRMKTLPQQLELLTRIEALYICHFDDMEIIPDWICNITPLRFLGLSWCGKLKLLPSKQVLQRLPGLIYLIIEQCPLLTERYAKNDGPEWHNISHINFVQFEGLMD